MADTSNSVLNGVPFFKAFLNKPAEFIIAAVIITFI